MTRRVIRFSYASDVFRKTNESAWTILHIGGGTMNRFSTEPGTTAILFLSIAVSIGFRVRACIPDDRYTLNPREVYDALRLKHF